MNLDVEFNEFKKKCLEGKTENLLRNLSIRISYPLYKRKIHPDVPTYLSLITNIIFPLFFLSNKIEFWIIPCIYYAFLSSILDMINGNLARALNLASKKGAILDVATETIGKAFFFIFLFYGCYSMTQDIFFLIIGIIFFSALYIRNLVDKTGYRLSTVSNKKIRDYDEVSVSELNSIKRHIVFIFANPTGIGTSVLVFILFTILFQKQIFLKCVAFAFASFYIAACIIRCLEWVKYYENEK